MRRFNRRKHRTLLPPIQVTLPILTAFIKHKNKLSTGVVHSAPVQSADISQPDYFPVECFLNKLIKHPKSLIREYVRIGQTINFLMFRSEYCRKFH